MVGTKEEIRKGPWREQEDVQLVRYVSLFGERRWDFIATVSGLNRTGKSCRLRWVNYLHPGLKRGRMTQQEERLVLELHSLWGNRWSRIARELPGRTDNEIKNYWRIHMRKKAQERKKKSSPIPSPSSSGYLSPSVSEPLSEIGAEKTEWQVDVGSSHPGTVLKDSDGVKGYPIDQIWKEIATSETTSGPSFEDCKDDVCHSYCPPMPSPLWEYYSDSLWRIDDEDLKMFNPVCDVLISNYQQETEP